MVRAASIQQPLRLLKTSGSTGEDAGDRSARTVILNTSKANPCELRAALKLIELGIGRHGFRPTTLIGCFSARTVPFEVPFALVRQQARLFPAPGV